MKMCNRCGLTTNDLKDEHAGITIERLKHDLIDDKDDIHLCSRCMKQFEQWCKTFQTTIRKWIGKLDTGGWDK